MGTIVVVFTACGLTRSGGKTKIMCSRTKGMPESIAIFSVEVAGQVYNQTNELIYLGGNVNHNPDMSLEVNRCIRNAWCNFRKYSLELYNRPSAYLELKPRMLTAEMLEIMPCDCIMRRPRACHNDRLHQAHNSFLTRCIGWQNNNTDNSISNMDTVMKTGGESMEAIKRRRGVSCLRYLWRPGRTEVCRSALCSKNCWGAWAAWGARKQNEWDVSWTTSELSVSTPTSRRLQPGTRVNSGRRRNKE